VSELSSKGNSNGWNGRSSIGQGELSVGGTSTAALDSAATAVARVQDEIDDLWRASMRIENELLAERLVEVSHALQRAARLLEQDRAIG
jgi:hypothetical protein